ncbi:glycosyltransferase family 4 protein [Planctellipticum variicoloris]|uniref:glycosyltransferase family 4 protein n=1 Tax=Planctellipticum variicoloris TaxID=3064265 RepID=UPI003013649F|nr:glycosyltransferase family 4 protein [Planctomycetaceae bacterium SH412]
MKNSLRARLERPAVLVGQQLLAAAARLRGPTPFPPAEVKRVVHVSPAYFADESMIGGGERYALELAAAMAKRVETTLLTFGPARRSVQRGELQIEIYPARDFVKGKIWNPRTLGFVPALKRFDAIHCHQHHTFVTATAACAAAAARKPCFVTDLGGGGWNQPATDRYITQFLEISRFAIRPGLADRSQIIYGAVGPGFIDRPIAPWPRPRRVLFVGRIMAHKGIDSLILAVDPDTELTIIGRVYEERYFADLQQLAAGRNVTFNTNASDDDLAKAYGSAAVFVLPSVYTDMYSKPHPKAELLGLVMLESLASETPVVCTQVGGMPEFIDEGVTGFIVPPSDPAALGVRIRELLDDPARAQQMGAAGRRAVLERFTWDQVALRCLAAYRGVANSE